MKTQGHCISLTHTDTVYLKDTTINKSGIPINDNRKPSRITSNNTHDNILNDLILVSSIRIKEYICLIILHIVRLVENIDNTLLKKSYQTLVRQFYLIHTKSGIRYDNGTSTKIKSPSKESSDRPFLPAKNLIDFIEEFLYVLLEIKQ